MSLKKTNGWTDLMAKSGVKVKYKYSECRDDTNDSHKEYVMLRFENITDEKVTVSWDHLLWYDGHCSSCDSDDSEFNKELQLGPKEERTGDCTSDTPESLRIFSEFLEKGKGRPDTKLTGIRLSNLKFD